VLLPKSCLYQGSARRQMLEVRERFGNAGFISAWHCRLDERPERVINEAFDSTDIYLVEDGVKTYNAALIREVKPSLIINDLLYLARCIRRGSVPSPIDYCLSMPGIPVKQFARIQRA